MAYQIVAVDASDPDIDMQLRVLFKEAFAAAGLGPAGQFCARVKDMTSGKCSMLAAVENDAILGCAAFIPTEFLHDGRTVRGYQVCQAATHPAHQGKSIFINIVNHAKEHLRSEGADFMFGLGNHNSNPILIKKLEFRVVRSVVTYIPNIPVVRELWFNRDLQDIGHYEEGAHVPVEEQILQRKLDDPTEKVEVVAYQQSFLWGKRKEVVRSGIRIPFFYCGGIHLAAAEDLRTLIIEVLRLHHVAFVQMVSCENNKYNRLISRWKTTRMNDFVFFDLKDGEPATVNAMFGVIDGF
jgi:predicted N-acetyltransferase YhbS